MVVFQYTHHHNSKKRILTGFHFDPLGRMKWSYFATFFLTIFNGISGYIAICVIKFFNREERQMPHRQYERRHFQALSCNGNQNQAHPPAPPDFRFGYPESTMHLHKHLSWETLMYLWRIKIQTRIEGKRSVTKLAHSQPGSGCSPAWSSSLSSVRNEFTKSRNHEITKSRNHAFTNPRNHDITNSRIRAFRAHPSQIP